MKVASREEVLRFLREFKYAMLEKGLQVYRRPENSQALADLGLTLTGRKDVILGLQPEDFSSGPEPDRNQPGVVWKFQADVEGRLVYIKLKLVVDGVIKRAVCWSFHEADSPMPLPYSEEEGG